MPLDTIASFKRDVTPLLINHLGQLPSTTISFNLAPEASLGEAMDSIDKVVKKELPANITTTYQGSAQAFQSSLAGLGALLILAIIVIYIVLGILYESFISSIDYPGGIAFGWARSAGDADDFSRRPEYLCVPGIDNAYWNSQEKRDYDG